MRRNLLAIVFAGCNFVLLSVALFLPSALGGESATVVAVSSAIIGLQASQSSVVQVGGRIPWPILRKNYVLAGLALVVGAVGALSTSLPVALVICSTISGAALGLAYGHTALELLNRSGGLAYQRFLCVRAFWFALASAAAGLLSRIGPEISVVGFIFAVSLPIFAARTMPPVFQEASSKAAGGGAAAAPEVTAGWVVFVGLAGSLFYRNDVNWIRASVADENTFALWHIALIAYSAVQGLVGFLTVQFVFAERERWYQIGTRLTSRYSIPALWTWLAFAAATILLNLDGDMEIVGAVALASIFTAAVGFFSAVAHAMKLNMVPYVAGIVGTLFVVTGLGLGLSPQAALLGDALIIGAIILSAFTWVSRRKWR